MTAKTITLMLQNGFSNVQQGFLLLMSFLGVTTISGESELEESSSSAKTTTFGWGLLNTDIVVSMLFVVHVVVVIAFIVSHCNIKKKTQ